jgi:hypothetical protein
MQSLSISRPLPNNINEGIYLLLNRALRPEKNVLTKTSVLKKRYRAHRIVAFNSKIAYLLSAGKTIVCFVREIRDDQKRKQDKKEFRYTG